MWGWGRKEWRKDTDVTSETYKRFKRSQTCKNISVIVGTKPPPVNTTFQLQYSQGTKEQNRVRLPDA